MFILHIFRNSLLLLPFSSPLYLLLILHISRSTLLLQLPFSSLFFTFCSFCISSDLPFSSPLPNLLIFNIFRPSLLLLPFFFSSPPSAHYVYPQIYPYPTSLLFSSPYSAHFVYLQTIPGFPFFLVLSRLVSRTLKCR